MEHNLQPPQKGERPRAEWGRAVVDSINAGRVTGGRGVLVSQDPTGTVLKFRRPWPAVREEARPMPFDVRVDFYEDAWLLQAWLPAEQTMLVSRTGTTAVNDAYAEMVDDGWVTLQSSASAPTGITLVSVEIGAAPTDGSVEYSWSFVIGAPEETGIDWLDHPDKSRMVEVLDRRSETPTLVAVVVGTAVTQYHRGAIDTFAMTVDSLDSDNRSLAVIEQLQAYQLYNFNDPDYRLTTPLDVSDTEHYDRVQILLRQRGADLVEAGDGPMDLHYASLGVLAQALVDAITTPHDDYAPDDSPWREAWDYYIGDRVQNLFGGGQENLTLIYNTLDGRYWVKGGASGNCYGLSIGNSATSGPIIDLANCQLTDGDGNENVQWVARILNGAAGTASVDWGSRQCKDGNAKTSVAWGERLLRDGAEVESINWADREMYDAGGVKVCDWDNCQTYSPANGWLTIDWEAMQLYSHVFEYGPPVKSLDWSACTTYDAAGNTTMSWRVRQLMGSWSVATGGSFATPSLALGGTTVTGVATVAVVTAVDFGTQTVTTQNVKVLT